MKNLDKNFIMLIIAFTLFICLSINANLMHIDYLFRDEAHAWTIAQNCSISEIFQLMKIEGHMLIWYLILMPFAKLKLWYPNIMLILNWLFCVGAIFLVVANKKMPTITKILLMFSPIFINLHCCYARCYSIGIFFLFLACSLYKKRLTHPYLYFLILFLAANTSILALAAAFPIGCLFLYDLYNEKIFSKQNLQTPILITIFTLLTGIMFYFQFFEVQIPVYATNSDTINLTKIFFYLDSTNDLKINILINLSRVIAIIFTCLFLKSKRALFIFLFSTLSISLMFILTYPPYTWHISFYFIYLFLSYWIFLEENENSKHIVNILMIFVIIFSYIYPQSINGENDFLPYIIINTPEFRNAKLYTQTASLYLCPYLPFINNANIRIYNLDNKDISSFEGLKTYYQHKEYNINTTDFDATKENYLISNKDLSENNKIKLYIKTPRYYIYKTILTK